jgi:DNA invertase Pin-like site-specific DNA recombinase
MTDKPTAQHLRRKAVLYVRQSTTQQLRRNEESRRLQYAMQQRLHSLGWRDIEVIDDDLGRSAGGTVSRPGFDRLVAEVSLGKVGGVAAREVSRFARNNRDWQQLVEVCRYVDTLLIDEETIYDARQGNDRLLLGVKGTLNEYELDLLRLRAVEAKREKARRGKYYARIPVGYRKTDDGVLQKDPDRRVRQVLDLIFNKTIELGSVNQLLSWLCEQGIEMPRNQGRRVLWKPPTYSLLISILKNPVYAGWYVYGKTMAACRFEEGEVQRRVISRPHDQWVSIPEHHEGYVTTEHFERIQQMIKRNAQSRARHAAAKAGPALLAGLLRCRRCGQKLIVSYSGSKKRIARYSCERAHANEGKPRCISFSSVDVDERIGAEVLDVVRPAAVDAALAAARDSQQEHDKLLETLRVDLEAARYHADRAWRQYDAVDPANRLVADELEARWNEALQRATDAEQRLEQQQQASGATASLDREHFAHLARDFGAVWCAPGVDVRLKKRLLRTLLREVVVDVDEASNEIVLVLHWKGGVHTELRVSKRRRGDPPVRTPDNVVAAVRAMALVCDDTRIASWLGRAGLLTARGHRWTRSLVASLRHQHKIPCYSAERQRAEGWMTKQEAAASLGVAERTLQRAVERGAVKAVRPLPTGLWIFNQADLRRSEVLVRSEQRPAGHNQRTGVPSHRQLSIDITDT